MSTPIKLLYNGKPFKNLENSMMSDVEKLLTLGMEQNIQDALAPLLPAIEKEGAEVTVDVKGPMMFEVSTKNISDKLKTKVITALTPSK